jgi:hypothetical protein
MENIQLSLLILEDKSDDKKIKKIDVTPSKFKNMKRYVKQSILVRPIRFIANEVFPIFRLNLFSHYKEKFVKPSVDQPVDLSELLRNIDRISCKIVKKGNYSQYFQDSDLKTISDYRLDFILRFGFNIIRGDILTVPKYGVWSFHHDDEEKYRGGPACFWEIYGGDPVTGAMLQRLTDRLDGGIVLRKGYFKTKDQPYSENIFENLMKLYSGNIDSVYVEAARWPGYVVRDLFNDTADYLFDPPSKTQAPVYRTPTNYQMIIYYLKHKIKSFFNPQTRTKKMQWNIGLVDKPIQNFVEKENKIQIQWYPLRTTDNFFLADPFGEYKDEKLTIFCEKCDLTTNFGEIVTLVSDKNSFSEPKKYFDKLSCHLSYPYLFNVKGEVYLVPESRKIREINLFKATKFPETWERILTIARDIDAADSAIFFYNDMWWLTYLDQSIGINCSLCILYAKDLSGPWMPHKANPVKQDVRSARPAGTPFIHNGSLYRPSQDCSERYGGRIIINKITILTPSKFQEEFVTAINPIHPFAEGIHTIMAVGNYTLIDGCRSLE